MRLLLVENDVETVGLFQHQLPRIAAGATLTVASNLRDALLAIESESFDIGVIDLRIPPSPEEATEADSHGLLVFETFATIQVASPIILFTGYPSFELGQYVLHRFPRGPVRCFGCAEHVAVYVITKDKAQDCFERIQTFAAELQTVEDVELEGGHSVVELSIDDKRVLKVAALLFGAEMAQISVIGGGLSGARTIRFVAKDGRGQTKAIALAKLCSFEEADSEERAYREHIAAMLPEGSFSSLIRRISAGGSRSAGLFYKLAESNSTQLPTTLFASLGGEPEEIGRLVRAICQNEERWIRDAPERRLSVGDIRRGLVPDDFDGEDFVRCKNELRSCETKRVLVRECSQHMDLHGANVLIRNGEPLIIDFGNVATSLAGFDPVVLELSLVSHPDGRAASGLWPTLEDAASWPDLESYVRNAPMSIRSFVRECRGWALSVANNRNAVLACAYAFSLRQLKYPDVDHAFFEAVARACCTHLQAT